ncbi:MAG TPA: hypothetical protein VEA38_01715 [Terriglobales bacterium]|nr:hypothetical protein [Terriglobales bacterium]
MTDGPADHLRARLARREWTVTVEVVTPPRDDERARARILALAAALRDDPRVAALTLTDRTTGAETVDIVELGALVAAASLAVPLIHVAGKGRKRANLEQHLARLRAAGLTSVLLTGGDVDPDAPGPNHDALSMFSAAATLVPDFLVLGVIEPGSGRPLDETRERAEAKRRAVARAGFVAQVGWDLETREAVAQWQADFAAPILGAVMWLTRRRVEFLAAHHIGGIVVPPGLRRRLNGEPPEGAQRRLALDLVLLRRLGYAGAHISGLLTPSRITAVLDEAARLDTSLGDDWRGLWREAAGIA